jgi:hypothetical protein
VLKRSLDYAIVLEFRLSWYDVFDPSSQYV